MNEWPTGEGGTPHLASAAETPPAPSDCICEGGGGMVLRRTLKIINSRGLHARASQPSASSVTSLPCPAPSIISPMMEQAGTLCPARLTFRQAE